LKTLQNLFDSVLTDVTKGIQEEDLVQVTLECPDLDFPISLLLSNGVILIGVVDIHDFAYRLHSDVSPSDGDTGYPFVCTTIRIRYMEKTLQNLFDSVLTDVTKGMQEDDLVQVTLECTNLDFPIRLPFIQMNQLTSELLLTEIERVLQSNEQFVLDHCVQLNITHVSLPKGGTGKKCDYVDTERFLKDKLCIIQIQNKDIMCCAKAIVTDERQSDGKIQIGTFKGNLD
jgi:hypothetical protein